MWFTKFKVFDEESVLSKIIRKNKVKIFYYPVNNYIKNNRFYFMATCLIKGNPQNKENYFKELKAEDIIKIHTRMLGRDRNFVYMRHNMLRGEELVNAGLFQSTFVQIPNGKLDLEIKRPISVDSAAEQVEHLGNLIVKLPRISLYKEMTKLRKLAIGIEEPLII
jgi:hypothetical protein